MRAAAIVVAWNGAEYLPPCLESLLEQETRCDIVVVDNASTDDTPSVVRSFAGRAEARAVRLELLSAGANLGFTRGANLGMRWLLEKAEHEMIVLLNQDATVMPECLRTMATLFEQIPQAAAVGTKMLYPDGRTLQHAGGYLQKPRLVGLHHGHHEIDRGAYDTTRDVEFVSAAAMSLRAAALREVGLFDEIFSPGYYEDVDLCSRLRAAGWRVLYCAGALAGHVESASFRDPFERRVLNHRNRLFYCFPSLQDPVFFASFAEAERAALATEPTEGLRALATAYLEVILRINELARTRLPPERRGRRERLRLVEMLCSLRDDCLAGLHIRRTQ
jgi:GT2 family glycosyltransferase